MRHSSQIILLLILGFCPLQASAQILDSVRGVAMGAVRGDPVGSSAVIYNPAGMSRAYSYSAELQYFRGGPNAVNGAGFTIVDSRTQPNFAVGLAYAYQFSDSSTDVRSKGHDGRIAFAHPVIPGKLSIGVSGHYVTIERETDTPGEVGPLEGFTADVGALLVASPSVQIGLVGHNLIEFDDPAFPRQFGGGLAYTGSPLVLTGDLLMDLQTHPDGARAIASTGGELLIGDSFPIRAGYTYDGAQETSFASGGIGVMTSGQGANAGQIIISYRQSLDTPEVFRMGASLVFFL